MGFQRSPFARIDEAVARWCCGFSQQKETAAAQTGAIGFGYRQGSRHGHSRVEGIAAGGEGFQAGDGGGRVGTGHQRLLRELDGRFGADAAAQQQRRRTG